jgi:acyl dehydratase
MTQADKNPFYLDDLQTGQRFTSRTQVVDTEQIIRFAKEFDPQPFHTDPEAARGTMFGGLIASGWHTAAISMRLLLDAFPIAGGNIGLGGEAAWPKPVRAGDTLHVECEIIDVRPSKSHADRGIVTVRSETKNQRNETTQILTAKMLAFRKG